MNSVSKIHQQLLTLANPEIAQHSQRFFKTGKGEYAEGDLFLGIRVPMLRAQVRIFKDISLADNRQLLHSKYHEERLLALFLLIDKFKRADDSARTKLYQFYLSNTRYINNWDLVDCSAQQIVGSYLQDRERQLIYQLAKSENLWERRIAIISTFHFIKDNDFDDCLNLASILLNDHHDLIHKAVGWMLREVGNRNRPVEESFLKLHYLTMPRTMLRYAIEKFDQEHRLNYLKGRI